MPAGAVIDVTFRAAVDTDALCISVLGTQVYLDTYAPDGIRPSLAREVQAHFSLAAISVLLSAPRSRFIVAERAGHMVAFAQLTMDSIQERVPVRPAAELNRLYVQERFAGRGVGTALLAHAEALAVTEGANTLWLTAWVGNHRALAYYARRDYKDFGATLYEFENEQYENRIFAKSLRATESS